ncbi:hypothetical protein DQ04_04801060 [Trypanosoma grayi]|uniref:hypothetical protein n=1 Tax=Trypanosoma grayi TaxID=71804 RepID=UPI0004F4438C|nr:hypothetical protein DQ04_04801060 [Trypanosoma grayi]KEG09694.1 hypothetical protein DQ04_04801060 [Trypanosoma grayi]
MMLQRDSCPGGPLTVTVCARVQIPTAEPCHACAACAPVPKPPIVGGRRSLMASRAAAQAGRANRSLKGRRSERTLHSRSGTSPQGSCGRSPTHPSQVRRPDPSTGHWLLTSVLKRRAVA